MKATILRPSDLDGEHPPDLNATQAILAEGDSWFDINQFPADNMLKHIQFGTATTIVNCAHVGDTMAHMVDRINSPQFRQLLAWRKWKAIMFSGGGNDLIDAVWDTLSQQSHVLKRASNPASTAPADWIDQTNLNTLWTSLDACFATLLAMRADSLSANRNTPILLHQYEFIIPRPEPARFKVGPISIKLGGPWLAIALQHIGAPQNAWDGIARNVMGQLGARIQGWAGHPNVFMARTHNTIKPAAVNAMGVSGDWANEIHPNSVGYRKLATPWRTALTAASVV
jgi:hypothetical protein